MLRPLPYGSPDRLVRLYESNPERGWPEFSASQPNYLDWRAQANSWEALAATSGGTAAITSNDGAEVVPDQSGDDASSCRRWASHPRSAAIFARTRIARAATRASTIITDGLWRRAFGADPGVLGRSLSLNTVPHTIVGVLPPRFDWGAQPRAPACPFAPDPAEARGDHQLSVIGLLKPTVSLDEARAELSGIAANLARQYPADNDGWGVRLVTFYDWLIPESDARVADRAAGRGAAGAADRLRQRRESPAGARRGAPERAGDPHGDRRVAQSPAVARRDGSGVTRDARRCRRTRPRGGHRSVCWPHTRPPPSRGSTKPRSICRVLVFAGVSAFVSAALFGLIPSLQAARDPRRPGPARRQPRIDRRPRTAAPARHADHCRGRAVGRAPDRRRAPAAQLREPAAGQRRLRRGRGDDRTGDAGGPDRVRHTSQARGLLAADDHGRSRAAGHDQRLYRKQRAPERRQHLDRDASAGRAAAGRRTAVRGLARRHAGLFRDDGDSAARPRLLRKRRRRCGAIHHHHRGAGAGSTGPAKIRSARPSSRAVSAIGRIRSSASPATCEASASTLTRGR